jgi:replicative DNA helicase
MKKYKISEIAKLSGASAKALRGYEEKGLLVPVRQLESNYRLYSEDMIDVIKNIKFLQGLGFSLSEISLIHKNKDVSLNNLKSIFKEQLRDTIIQLSNLSERKLVLSNIINKFDEEEIGTSSILTAKEKDVFMGITTGFTKLDKLLESNEKGQLVFIAARPGMGKTALTVHIAYNLIEQTGSPVSFFSTEFAHEEWVERLAIQRTQLDRYRSDLTEDEQLKLIEARDEIKKKSIYYRHSETISVDEIIEKTLEIKSSLSAVVIDYYQDICGDIKTKCNKLKELSRKLDCPVLVISTVTEDADTRDNMRPLPEDLRDFENIKDKYDKLLAVSQNPNLHLSESKKIANIDVYNRSKETISNINLVWDGTYCGYTDTL